MNRKQPLQLQPLLELGPGGCWINLVDEEQNRNLLRYSEMESSFKQNDQIKQLMQYRLRKQETNQLSEKECVEDEDALRLMTMICGGYVEDDFATHLSYNDFQEKKEDFGVLRNVYQSIQKKYHNKKVEESSLKFRSVLLMAYLQQNIPKMSRVRIEELFAKNRMVW